jgi:hypothetical protein
VRDRGERESRQAREGGRKYGRRAHHLRRLPGPQRRALQLQLNVIALPRVRDQAQVAAEHAGPLHVDGRLEQAAQLEPVRGRQPGGGGEPDAV